MSALEKIEVVQQEMAELAAQILKQEASIENQMAEVEIKKARLKELDAKIDLAVSFKEEDKTAERDSFSALRLALEGVGDCGTALDQYMRERGLEPTETEEEIEAA